MQDVRETITALADVAEAQTVARNDNNNELNGTRTYLDSVQQSVNEISNDDPNADSEDKLIALRDHLLSLSKAEGQLQKIKEKALETQKSTRTEISVIETLELWQEVFRETFQQYHRLSTRLVKNEDGAAALRLWQEYLVHVQQFLSGTIPSDYHSLSEHQHLCQLHQNLLTTQQNVLKPVDNQENLASGIVETSVLEQFNSLSDLHNETLERIIERHAEVQSRLNAWDQYRQDQNKLLSWLKDMEKERERLQLRYVHARRIPKVLSRLDNILGKIPQGEERARNLQKQQKHLLQFSDDALATSIRMEHVAITQRIANLRAGLETWKKFIERIAELIGTHEDHVQNVQHSFDDIQELISTNSSQDLPATHSAISIRLETLQRTRGKLADLTKELEQLGISQEQLKECVSPSDMKTINQRMWLLRHQHSDLEHQLASLCHRLEEKLGVRTAFETRQSRFMAWADAIENRLENESTPTDAKDPEEALRKLETDLHVEMGLKEREYKWLVNTGEDLVAACGEEYSDIVAKQNIQARVNEVIQKWEDLENIGKTKAGKIHDMMQTMLQLEVRLAEIRTWLNEIELELAKPMIFEGTNKSVIDSKLQEHDKLKKRIENESGKIGEVLNLCELILSDAGLWKTYFTTENISVAAQNVEKRWKNVCGLSAERKRKIQLSWKLVQEVLRLSNENEQWVTKQEQALKEAEEPLVKASKDKIQERISTLENQISEIESHEPAYEILEQTYGRLVKSCGIEPQNVKELTSKAREVIIRWQALKPRATDALQKLKNELAIFRDFSEAHGNAVVNLAKVDARLTELQHLAENEDAKSRLKQLAKVEDELTAQNSILDNADKLGLLLIKKSDKTEVTKIQEMIEEYQSLWKDIQERIIKLKLDLQEQITQQMRREVDEGVQVETLKFEQDTAVQVNTLHPQLQRMTSISAKDAYMVEFSTALAECQANVEKLEEMVGSEIAQQGSSELHMSGKQIAKLTGTCQSNVELVKHLHDLLVNECDASEDEARSEEVQQLIEKFDELLGRAKQKEQKIRELRYVFNLYYNVNIVCLL